jgi:hypothetical protein
MNIIKQSKLWWNKLPLEDKLYQISGTTMTVASITETQVKQLYLLARGPQERN